ncbi:50S ribosomal protein L11 methyltransferase [Mucilaginibacter sp. UR6-1]|uniref:50S ribosomal protein L11 methyltransferase n=1 Tax=Mucilaginibacter sp. UR6-1 TaxID=1435643 RepID=UPI001E6551BC|nr:50S ribosomal protein L11 methyltransferase [Mucilaginibacter sp. UR6-1]MCC8409215.1 50S ribosomal protein L11 methyltransferase [Mucilaginibacter sp. UR6-1]
MDYYEIDFTLPAAEDYQRDLLIDALAGLGCDTFEETETGFRAYIPSVGFNQQAIDDQLSAYKNMVDYTYQVNLVPQKNWNEAWESNFEPIEIQDQVFVRATFHQPRAEFPYEIVIDPKMAFGTGHHQTTSMMLELMLSEGFEGKQVLDMGCGTGILAIMASKLGAKQVMAIDYDPVCYDSTIENAALNNADNITALCGSKEAIPDARYDVILANINRNILLDQMASYAGVLKPDGVIFFSGFYETPDLDIIKEAAAAYGLTYTRHLTRNDWVAARFVIR